MEVCGGQTHTIVKYGIDKILPAGGRAGARAGLPGLRDFARDDRPGARDRLAAGGHLLLVRRHAPRPRVARRPAPAQVAGERRADRLFAARRREPGGGQPRAGRSCSSRSGSRPPRRPTRWPSGMAQQRGLANFSVLVSHVLVPPMMTAHPRIAGQSGPGVPGAGPRLHRDGVRRI